MYKIIIYMKSKRYILLMGVLSILFLIVCNDNIKININRVIGDNGNVKIVM